MRFTTLGRESRRENVSKNKIRIKRDISLFWPLLLSSMTLFIIVTGGVIAFVYIEEWSLADSLYMVLITLSTVGFGEVNPLTESGKVITSVVILFGVGNFAFFFGLLLQYFSGVSIYRILKRKRTRNMLRKMKNHCIVCGYGRMGEIAAHTLMQSKKPVVIIDPDPTRLTPLEKSGIPYIIGNASEDEILQQANIAMADSLLVSVSDESSAAFITLSARQLNETIRIIVRVEMPKAANKFFQAGANHVYYPYEISGKRMAKLIVEPQVAQFLDEISSFDSSSTQPVLAEATLRKHSTLIGKSIREADVDNDFKNIVIISVITISDGNIYNPAGNYVFNLGDTMIFTCLSNEIALFKEKYRLA